MDEPRNVPFGEMLWTDDAPGIRARETDVEGSRWAVVEYGKGASREDWCEEGHRGYVISGEIEYQFDDGRKSLRAAEGEAFRLPPAPLEAGAHRGRNVAPDRRGFSSSTDNHRIIPLALSRGTATTQEGALSPTV